MRNLLILLIGFAITLASGLSGCSNIKIDPEMKDFVIETAAEMAGYEIGDNNPQLIDVAITYCDGMIESGITESIFSAGVDLLLERYSVHPVLKSRLQKLIGYVHVDTGFNPEIALSVVKSFRDGLELAKGQ